MSESPELPAVEPRLESELRALVNNWQRELQAFLPGHNDEIKIEFDNNYLVPGFATGGATWNPRLIKLAYDPNFVAPQEQKLAELKATYFHESYHAFRGYSFETTPADQPALGIAIEEGLATKFEMEFAGSDPGYSKYEDWDTMLSWLKEVKSLPDGFDYDWQKYKFYDKETGRRCIWYKVGLFIVDEATKNSSPQTLDALSNLTSKEILALSGL